MVMLTKLFYLFSYGILLLNIYHGILKYWCFNASKLCGNGIILSRLAVHQVLFVKIIFNVGFNSN